MKKAFSICICLVSFLLANAQGYSPTAENIARRTDFQDNKFGMFIHWGPFSIPGSGEWVMNQRNITVRNYTRLMDMFNPIYFDAPAWVGLAKNAGMKYITLITRHHDGFSMWDTKFSDFNIMNSPYKKDVVRMMADECHKQGIKLFLYYSLLDWRRDDYSWKTGNTGKGTGRTVQDDWNSYIKFMENQLTELLTNYGEIGGIWFDGYWDQVSEVNHTRQVKVDWHMAEIYALIHRLQPACLIGNNHHSTPIGGEDFQMFEKDLPGRNTTGFGGAAASTLPMETCETMNDSWGFNITDASYKSTKRLVQYLVTGAGMNANFLLNIGPMPNGKIQPEFIDTLKAVGEWIKKYGQTIYGTRGGLIDPREDCTITAKGKTLYLHILKKPLENYIFLPSLKEQIAKAATFDGKMNVAFKQQKEGLFIFINDLALNDIDTIIELTIK
jgi:alpha-L-fucosidase